MNNKSTTINDCNIITLNKIHNLNGNITVVENNLNIPFEIERVYYLYDVPSNQSRGGHAHYDLKQFIVAASGSFDVVLKDGTKEKIVSLNRPNMALQIVPGIWRELCNFSGGSICLVLASNKYSEKDYIRNYSEFIKWKSER